MILERDGIEPGSRRWVNMVLIHLKRFGCYFAQWGAVVENGTHSARTPIQQKSGL